MRARKCRYRYEGWKGERLQSSNVDLMLLIFMNFYDEAKNKKLFKRLLSDWDDFGAGGGWKRVSSSQSGCGLNLKRGNSQSSPFVDFFLQE